jgi:tRNA (cytidine56-2'-O)-methyltransferase
MKLVVLRMGHRLERDKRMTTHIALVARAFGADGVIISDIIDSQIQLNIKSVIERFGGNFFIEMGEKWHKILKSWKENGNEIVHLTMYGLSLPTVIEEIRHSQKDKLIVVGAAKVPRAVYDMADYNVSVTSQPHSEIAALAVFLDYFFQGGEFKRKLENAQLEIIPDKTGKVVKKVEK